jgi:hypothetical protein
VAQLQQGRCREIQAVAATADALTCYIFRFLTRPLSVSARSEFVGHEVPYGWSCVHYIRSSARETYKERCNGTEDRLSPKKTKFWLQGLLRPSLDNVVTPAYKQQQCAGRNAQSAQGSNELN